MLVGWNGAGSSCVRQVVKRAQWTFAVFYHSSHLASNNISANCFAATEQPRRQGSPRLILPVPSRAAGRRTSRHLRRNVRVRLRLRSSRWHFEDPSIGAGNL